MASWSCGDCHDDNGEYHSFVAGYDAFNLINMNGRLYDPVNGRMLSVDNYVQDGLGSQGYNRYSYAGNNPLKYTDPSGEVVTPVHIGAAVAGGLYNLFSNWHNIDSWKSGLGYFGVGAVAGLMVTTGNIGGARGLLTGGNIAIQAITGHLPKVDFKNAPSQSALDLGVFALKTTLDAISLPGVAKIGGNLATRAALKWTLWNTISNGEVVVHAARSVQKEVVAKVVAAETVKEFAKKGGTTVFRAVDAAESAIIKSTGEFSLQQGGLEAKYFAKSLEDAHWYGSRLYPNGYSIVKGTVKAPVNAAQHWFEHIDIGAYVFPKEALPYIIPH